MYGDVRLWGGNESEGVLQVFMDKEWGSVCDNSWDFADADVACRQLGFASATSDLEYRYDADGNFKVVDAACTGLESRLVECRRGYDFSRCNIFDEVGLVCSMDTVPGKVIPNSFLVFAR